VLKASDGHPLLAADHGGSGLAALLKKATVLTPNLPELRELTGLPVQTPAEGQEAAATLFAAYPNLRAVILTGGHLREEEPLVEDFLIRRHGPGLEVVTSRHGTGCTFASAFAAYHLRCGDDRQAFFQATAFLDTLLRQSTPLALGKGRGPLAHHLFRRPEEA